PSSSRAAPGSSPPNIPTRPRRGFEALTRGLIWPGNSPVAGRRGHSHARSPRPFLAASPIEGRSYGTAQFGVRTVRLHRQLANAPELTGVTGGRPRVIRLPCIWYSPSNWLLCSGRIDRHCALLKGRGAVSCRLFAGDRPGVGSVSPKIAAGGSDRPQTSALGGVLSCLSAISSRPH